MQSPLIFTGAQTVLLLSVPPQNALLGRLHCMTGAQHQPVKLYSCTLPTKSSKMYFTVQLPQQVSSSLVCPHLSVKAFDS